MSQPLTIHTVDLLDTYMDIIRDHVLDPSDTELGDAYWQVRQASTR